MRRNRSGGTSQTGHLEGIRIGVEFLRACLPYAGIDFLYAEGNLRGKTGSGRTLRSMMRDEIFEFRLGHTLLNTSLRCTYITPFMGWGYFREMNTFVFPSPIPCQSVERFDYFVVGFLSGVNFTPLISMGINFKVKFMLNGKATIKNDPQFDTVTLQIQNETQYRLDLPLTFSPFRALLGGVIQINPFYEFRHFGGREGFPFDYKDTKFHIYGARVSLIYGF